MLTRPFLAISFTTVLMAACSNDKAPKQESLDSLSSFLTTPMTEGEISRSLVLQNIESQVLKFNDDFDPGLDSWPKTPNPCSTSSESSTNEDNWSDFIQMKRLQELSSILLYRCASQDSCSNAAFLELQETDQPGILSGRKRRSRFGSCLNSDHKWTAQLEGETLNVRYERRVRAFPPGSQDCETFMDSDNPKSDSWDVACSLNITLKQVQTSQK